jgi:hypothetical protein
MTQTNLFYKDKNETHYFSKLDQECFACSRHIINYIHIIQLADKNFNILKYFCDKCFNKYVMDRAHFQKHIVAVVHHTIPEDATPILNFDVSLSAGNISCIDHALKNYSGEQVIDKTVYAGRESFQGATIGKPGIVEELDYKDKKKLSNDDILKLVNDIRNAQPIISYDEKKLLGDDNEQQ